MMMIMNPINLQFSYLNNKIRRNPHPNSCLQHFRSLNSLPISNSHEPTYTSFQSSKQLAHSLRDEIGTVPVPIPVPVPESTRTLNQQILEKKLIPTLTGPRIQPQYIPIEEALTPPSSWYTSTHFLSLEFDQVFFKGWQAVGCTAQLQEANTFFTGRLGNIEYVVCRDENGELRAFHNVCRHHASLLVSGSGKGSCFTCPYHGWTYGLNGSLLKATRITGIKNFNVKEFGLVPLRVALWGPFILLKLETESCAQLGCDDDVGMEWLGSASEILSTNGVDASLSYLCRREYTIECNWKIICENHIDGGYHVPFVHKDLPGLDQLDSLSTTVYEKVSILGQEAVDRVGYESLYAFIYPNFIVNRYGPWMDTNLVLPLGPGRCKVLYDYFLDASLKDDDAFVDNSLGYNEKLQKEDFVVCESVQRGLESPAYGSGRYAPIVEKAMHHFHSLLHENLKK